MSGDGYIVSDIFLEYGNVGEFDVSIMAITDSQSEGKSMKWISELGMTLSFVIISKSPLDKSTVSTGLGAISEVQSWVWWLFSKEAWGSRYSMPGSRLENIEKGPILTVRDGVEIVSREDIIRLISASEMLGEVDCS